MPKPTKKNIRSIPETETAQIQVDDLPQDSRRWQAWYTPLWHAVLDCGIHASRDDAKLAIAATISEFVRGTFGIPITPSLDWLDSENGSIATGDDGSPQTTTLPIAKIEGVR